MTANSEMAAHEKMPGVFGVDPVDAMLEAISDVTRFATRGCSATACDRVRVVWMGHQLHTIASQARELPPAMKDSHRELPWERLDQMADVSSGTPGGLTADEMQRFVERDLPRFRKVLVPLTKG
jgi:uncharacterized protein with HEPN domain